MEKENWNLSSFGLEIQTNDLNSTQQEVPNCYFNPNWGHSMDHNEDPFESTLSSIVSSPAASNAAGIPISGTGESVVLRELIGRLGTICNSSNNSCNTSCYNTPLNSPPKLNLSTRDHNYQFPFHPNLGPFPSDPGFAERATRFSSHGLFGRNEIEFPPNGQRSTMESNNDGISGSEKKFGRENGDFGDSREESSVSEQNPDGEIGIEGQKDANSRKRKAIPRGKAKEITSSSKDSKVAGESTDVSSKRSKADEKEKDGAKEKAEENGSGKSGGEGNQREIRKESAKPPEPPKDYIHVRARRGQATDSHSLAERVRREKIGERMKFLQDLVPGCNKVTGKAVMLDEIINYVQSLQRQVEFLSMKLATVNPRMDFNTEALMSKDIFQSHGSLQHSLYSLATPGTVLPYGYQSQQLPPLNSGISNGTELPFSMNHLNAASQIATYSEDDLQSVFQMGFGQNQPPSFPGTTATTQMKVEL